MLKRLIKFTILFWGMIIGLVVAPSKSFAAELISPESSRQFEDINAAFDAQDYSLAFELLDRIRSGAELSPLEQAYVLNYTASINYQLGDHFAAHREYLKILELEETVSAGFIAQIAFRVAQLEYSMEYYDDAIEHVQGYLATKENGDAKAFVLLAQAYYGAGEYCKASEYIASVMTQGNLFDKSDEQTFQNILQSIKEQSDRDTLENCASR